MDVLLVEDQADLSQVWADYLGHLGHRVRLVDSVEGARRVLGDGFAPKVAIVDWSLADGYADGLVDELREDHPGCVVALTTGHGEDVAEVVGHRVKTVLRKPFSLKELARFVAGG
jgi:DNA-binding NtrC family response regulator